MKKLIVETKNGARHWVVNSECRRELQPIAKKFGMGIERFLFLYSLKRLPGQFTSGGALDEQNAPDGFAVDTCEDPLIWNRVQRAARYDGLSIKDYVWRALASSVNCVEEDVILSPRTGEIVAENNDVRKFSTYSMRREG